MRIYFQTQKKMKPNANEFLIVVLGGPNEGESIVIHLGDDRWMIIDSSKIGKEVLALKYLEDNEISYDNVDIIVCTHWHADHIYGIGEILKKCKNAKFWVPIVSQSKMMPYYFIKKIKEKDIHDFETVAEEYAYCMKLANKRGKLEYLFKDGNSIKYRNSNHNISIDALSPSSGMVSKYQKLWASRKKDQFAESGVDPNKSSVAIDISIDDKLHFLFGADLECNRPENDTDFENCIYKCERRKDVGWCNVCVGSSTYDFHGKYNYIKIIHHSSKTGYCPQLWGTKVTDEVVGVTTVFSKDGLPQNDMEVLYWDRCKDYYVTAPPIQYQQAHQTTDIERMQKAGVVSDIKVLPRTYGTVASKYNIEECKYEGTELGGTAFRFEEKHIYKFG